MDERLGVCRIDFEESDKIIKIDLSKALQTIYEKATDKMPIASLHEIVEKSLAQPKAII